MKAVNANKTKLNKGKQKFVGRIILRRFDIGNKTSLLQRPEVPSKPAVERMQEREAAPRRNYRHLLIFSQIRAYQDSERISST
jgi:hypothetical protein